MKVQAMFSAILKKISVRSAKKKGTQHGYLCREYRQPATGQGKPGSDWRRKFSDLFRRIVPKRGGGGQPAYARNSGRAAFWGWLIPVLLVVTVPVLFYQLGTGERMVRGLQGIAFFQVTEFDFSGNDILSNEQLREASGVIRHRTSLIGLDLGEIEARLLANPWLAKAVVRRDFPSTLRISVVEHRPIALLQGGGEGGELAYIDGKGTSFLSARPGKDLDFPVITGLMEITEPSLRKEAMAEVLLFLRRIEGNNPHLPAESVSEVHVRPDGTLVVYLVEYPFPIYFGNGNTSRKYFRLVEVLKALYKKEDGRERIAHVRYIDLDYLQDKVLVAQNDAG